MKYILLLCKVRGKQGHTRAYYLICLVYYIVCENVLLRLVLMRVNSLIKLERICRLDIVSNVHPRFVSSFLCPVEVTLSHVLSPMSSHTSISGLLAIGTPRKKYPMWNVYVAYVA